MKCHLFRFRTRDGERYERQYDWGWATDEGAIDRLLKEVKIRQQITVVHHWVVHDGASNHISSRWIVPVGKERA